MHNFVYKGNIDLNTMILKSNFMNRLSCVNEKAVYDMTWSLNLFVIGTNECKFY